MKIMKYCILTMMSLLLLSCSEFLEEDMKTKMSADSHYMSEQGINDALEAAYTIPTSHWCCQLHFTLCTFGTDAHTHGADGDYHSFNHYDGGLNASNDGVESPWETFYRTINQANAVIDRTPSVEMDETLKLNLIGEARWLRAWSYFQIVRTWGDCHLTLEETLFPEYTVNWVEQSEVYEAIIRDLIWVIDSSRLTPVPYETGRVTKTAAEILLGHCYLRRAWMDFTPDKNADLTSAELLLTTVINTPEYQLEDDVRQIWGLMDWPNSVDIEGSDESTEFIFALQSNKDLQFAGGDDLGHRGHLYFKMPYDLEAGMERDMWNGRPWRRFSPTDFHLSRWDRENDSRFDKLYKRVWYSNNPGSAPKWKQSDADKGYCTEEQVGQGKYELGDTAFYFPGPGEDDLWDADREARSRFKVYQREYYTLTRFPELLKFYDPYKLETNSKMGSRDQLVYRLAEAYLFRAEARYLLGNSAGAAEDINVIRRRAAWKEGDVLNKIVFSNRETEMEITAGDVDMDLILDERLREFDGENKRWFDLQRTGTLVERVRLYNKPYVKPEEYSNQIQDYHIYRPVPQSTIDAAANSGEINMQNPGYPAAASGQN